MRLPRPDLIAVFVCLTVGLQAAGFESRVESLFRPPIGDMMALSPDGGRVAYTAHSGGKLTVVMMSVEPPGPKRTVVVNPDAEVPSGAAPAHLRFLRWANASRLVFAPSEQVVPLPPIVDTSGRSVPNPDGPTILAPVYAVDADGRQLGLLVDARQFQDTPAEARRSLADLLRTTKELQATRNEPVRWRMPHVDLLGFLPRDREQLIIQTHGAYSIPMQHLVDIRTGSVREFGGDWPVPPGEPQVFDLHRLKVVGEKKEAARPLTVWRDDDLARLQGELELKFPRRVVEILDWAETRSRILCRVTGGSDPGRIFVYQRTEDLALEILRCAPWLNAARLHETRYFEFSAADGAPLSGYVTWPNRPRINPAPLLVVFASGFPGRAQPAFDPESQVFADLGYAVLRLNHRCVAGLRPEDLAVLRTALDRVSIEDAQAAIAWVASKHPKRPFDTKRVTAIGRGFGGFLAVRALQVQPGVFRCGIAIDAPMDLRPWLRVPPTGSANVAKVRDVPVTLVHHDATDWKKLSIVDQADTLSHPVLLVVEKGRNAEVDATAEALRTKAQRLGRSVEYLEAETGLAAKPAARAAMYRKIDEFLTQRLRTFDVKIGPVVEVTPDRSTTDADELLPTGGDGPADRESRRGDGPQQLGR